MVLILNVHLSFNSPTVRPLRDLQYFQLEKKLRVPDFFHCLRFSSLVGPMIVTSLWPNLPLQYLSLTLAAYYY